MCAKCEGEHTGGRTFAIGLGLLLILTLLGCARQSGVSESYFVSAQPEPLDKPYIGGTPIRLAAGQKQKVAVTISYRRSQRTAAKLKYTVRFSAPTDLTFTPTTWDVQKDLTTDDAGFNYTGGVSIDVAAGATPGEQEVKVTIAPPVGAPSTATLKFQVAKKDH